MKDSEESNLNESSANPSPVVTEDVLRALGFKVDQDVLSDGALGFKLRFW